MRLLTSLRYRRDNLRVRLERWRARSTVRRFQILYYADRDSTWANTYFLGVQVAKNPCDLWAYQEIVFETRPDLIIEAGTARGGSALYFATLCDIAGRGRVVSVDIKDDPGRPRHERITYVRGSSVEPDVVAKVGEHVRPGERVMVVLDSDHTEAHVLKELEIYGPLVTPGCYMVVEDTCLNGNPVQFRFGPGPAEAVRRFLRADRSFEVDRGREKFKMTFNPGGFLRRVGPGDV